MPNWFFRYPKIDNAHNQIYINEINDLPKVQ